MKNRIGSDIYDPLSVSSNKKFKDYTKHLTKILIPVLLLMLCYILYAQIKIYLANKNNNVNNTTNTASSSEDSAKSSDDTGYLKANNLEIKKLNIQVDAVLSESDGMYISTQLNSKEVKVFLVGTIFNNTVSSIPYESTSKEYSTLDVTNINNFLAKKAEIGIYYISNPNALISDTNCEFSTSICNNINILKELKNTRQLLEFKNGIIISDGNILPALQLYEL